MAELAQYAALPYVHLEDGLRICLITSRGTKRWIIPKGWPKAQLRPHELAAQEAEEEAGLLGEIASDPIGSYSYRSSIAVMGGKFLIPLSSERRAESGLKGGDPVEVQLALDDAPRVVTVPEDLSAALAGDAIARAFFEKLSYSNQLRHVLSITDAKTAETRQRRVDKAMETLRAGQK